MLGTSTVSKVRDQLSFVPCMVGKACLAQMEEPAVDGGGLCQLLPDSTAAITAFAACASSCTSLGLLVLPVAHKNPCVHTCAMADTDSFNNT